MNRQQKRWKEKHPQTNMNPQEPSEEEKKAFEAAMNEEHTLVFKKKELVVIFNILTKIDMKYGDSLIIAPIVQKLEKIVAVESNITNITKRAEEAEKNHLALGKKENN